MTPTMTRLGALALVTVLAAFGGAEKSDRMYLAQPRISQAELHPNETPELRALISKYSASMASPRNWSTASSSAKAATVPRRGTGNTTV